VDEVLNSQQRKAVAGLSLAVAAIVMGVGPTPAHAAGTDGFATPLLGSTVSQQWSRLPDPAALLCGERCETGILRRPAFENGAAEYIPAGPGSWGVLADNPALVGKVARFYRGGDVYAGAQIIEVVPGSSMETIVKDLVKDDRTLTASAPGLRIASTTEYPDGWTLYLTNAATPGDYPEEKLRAAYATKGNEIVRITCSGPVKAGEKLCGGIGDTALAIARTAPSSSVDPAVADLAPATPIPGLVPVLASDIRSRDFWGVRAQAPKPMMNALAPMTLTLQWSVPGYPRLAVLAAVVSSRSQAGLSRFLSTLCERGDETCTRRSDLGSVPVGGQAAGTAFIASTTEGTGIGTLEYQAGDGRLLVDVACTANAGRELTTREVAACRRAITDVTTAWFPS